MTFGEKLLRQRRQSGMSQEELAERLNVSRQAISRWELGETLPDAPNLLQISRLFGVSVDYLLHDECDSDRDTPAARTVGQDLAKEWKLRLAFIAGIGLHVLGMFYTLAGFYLLQRPLIGILGVTMSICGVIGFEVGFHMTKVWGMQVKEASDYRRRYYRIVVWLVAFYPIRSLVYVLFRLVVRPVLAIVPELVSVAVYAALCLAVTWALRKKP